MSKAFKTTFAVHAVVSLLFGFPLLIIPGRFLDLFGWVSIDPHISRLLGAALLAFSWSSYRGYRTSNRHMQQALVQMELIFCALGAIGLFRHILIAWYPWYYWTIFILLVVFAILWLYFLLKKPE